ncbi:MAG: hypothetical protein ABIQ09_16145 [Jatrophihabitantaceae bacterium]
MRRLSVHELVHLRRVLRLDGLDHHQPALYRNGAAFTVGDNKSSVKFLCNGSSLVAIGLYYTEDGV